jgi:exo-beta-1,3-glucanase (GH17 family)
MNGKGENTGALQAEWIGKMWGEIESNFDGTGAGGYLFSLKDEAWKGASDSGPNIGVENRLGVFTADGQPKEAARLLMRLWKPKTENENP